MAFSRRLAKELKDLKECEDFSFINITETEIGGTSDQNGNYFIKWVVEVDKPNNTKGQMNIEVYFPSNFFIDLFSRNY